ncbi:MAG TPA: GNAT family N-acetyltransferase [Candidatus Limnocylindria bacterium]
MPIEARRFTGTMQDYGKVVDLAFGSSYDPADDEAFQPFFSTYDVVGAYDGDRMVGGGALWRTTLTVPGGEVPASAVTAVGVLPTHRRRGALTAMMRRQLDDVHASGDPLAMLWASEGGIYGRFGYGMATINAVIEAERSRIAFRDPAPPSGTVRFVEADEAKRLLPALFEQVRDTRAGFFARPEQYWGTEIFYDPPHRRRGGGPLLYVVHETGGTDDGYALYRINQDWGTRGPASVLNVYELTGTTPQVHAELWQFVFGVDLIATVRARPQPPDAPLLRMVTEPRRLGMTLGDGMWLRLVDVAAALESRGYAGDGSVVIELRDAFCEWNAGRWSLEAGPAGADVTRTKRDADVALDVADLAALYLGGATFAALRAANRGEELSEGGAARFDALFRTDLAPFCPLIF